MMRGRPQVALTGATGYLGGPVLQALEAAGVGVVLLPFRRFVHEGCSDVRRDLLRSDVLCHLAGANTHQPGPPTDDDYWVANVDGTRRLLDAVQPRSRVVYASSAMAADASPKRGDACGRQAYANAKRAAEMLVDAHA